jgi:hypothetical protein
MKWFNPSWMNSLLTHFTYLVTLNTWLPAYSPTCLRRALTPHQKHLLQQTPISSRQQEADTGTPYFGQTRRPSAAYIKLSLSAAPISSGAWTTSQQHPSTAGTRGTHPSTLRSSTGTSSSYGLYTPSLQTGQLIYVIVRGHADTTLTLTTFPQIPFHILTPKHTHLK